MHGHGFRLHRRMFSDYVILLKLFTNASSAHLYRGEFYCSLAYILQRVR